MAVPGRAAPGMEEPQNVRYDEESADEDDESDSSYASSYDEDSAGKRPGGPRQGAAGASQPGAGPPVPPIPLVPGLTRPRGPQQPPPPRVPSLGLRRVAPDAGIAPLAERLAEDGGAGSRAEHPANGELAGPARPPPLRLGGTAGPCDAPRDGTAGAAAPRPGSLAVSLLSPAFTLEPEALDRARSQGLPSYASVGKRVAERLGVRTEELAFFELRPVQGEAHPAQVAVVINHSGKCRRVVVYVLEFVASRDEAICARPMNLICMLMTSSAFSIALLMCGPPADFSLSALEGVLAENKHLRQTVEKGQEKCKCGLAAPHLTMPGPLTGCSLGTFEQSLGTSRRPDTETGPFTARLPRQMPKVCPPGKGNASTLTAWPWRWWS